MADYSQFGSPSEEWLSLVRDNELFVPPVPPPLQTQAQRRHLQATSNEARCRASAATLQDLGSLDVTAETVSILCRDFQEIGARVYSPRAKVPLPEDTGACNLLLYFHGGGFLSGGLSTEDATCVQLANSLNLIVVSVNYRHTPEWTYPTQFEDAWDARCKILHEPQTLSLPKSKINLYVAGISSGACLAASLTVREMIVNDIRIQGQALWMPWLCHPKSFPYDTIVSLEKSSPVQCRNAPLLSYGLVEAFADMLQVDEKGQTDVVVNPLLCDCAMMARMPPTHILVCGNDPLRDHGMIFTQNLYSAGVNVRSKIYSGLPHGFRRIEGLKSNCSWDQDLHEGVRWLQQQNHRLK